MNKQTVCASCNDPCFGRRGGKGACRDCLRLDDHKWESALEESQRIREASHGESLLAKALTRGSFLPTDLENYNLKVAALKYKSLPNWAVPTVAQFLPGSIESYLFLLFRKV